MKFRVTWWIHGAGRICRGHDVIESKEQLDENDVENLIQKDLDREDMKSGFGPYNYGATGDFKANLPNFMKTHKDLRLEDRHTEVSNYGVLSVRVSK